MNIWLSVRYTRSLTLHRYFRIYHRSPMFLDHPVLFMDC